MLVKKPQLTLRDKIGRFGVGYVKNIIENGWGAILQDFQGTNDRGLDGIVLDVHLGRMASTQFAVQIKTGNFNKKFLGDIFPSPVETKHVVFWRELNMPVVLICVDKGPPPIAYWRLIRPGETSDKILVCRHNVFNPASRNAVISAVSTVIKECSQIRISTASSKTLYVPLHQGIRDIAKDYYYQELMGNPHYNPVLGPVEFTWKAWCHITRQSRGACHVFSSLILLPCVRQVLDSAIFRVSRSFPPIHKGESSLYRSYLNVERRIIFPNRAPSWVRVVVEQLLFLPKDWATSPPDDPRREMKNKFLSIYELKPQVKAGELTNQ